MTMEIIPVTEKNRKEVEALHVASFQSGYVESVKECLEEADEKRCWRPVALYEDGVLVGFAMYGFFWMYFPFGRVWLDRILIDERYQGKGYGKKAVSLLLKRLRKEYHRHKIYLSVVEGNDVAIHLYEELGFHFTGELDLHGEKVMVCHIE